MALEVEAPGAATADDDDAAFAAATAATALIFALSLKMLSLPNITSPVSNLSVANSNFPPSGISQATLIMPLYRGSRGP